jgi:hypothetical protein
MSLEWSEEAEGQRRGGKLDLVHEMHNPPVGRPESVLLLEGPFLARKRKTV